MLELSKYIPTPEDEASAQAFADSVTAYFKQQRETDTRTALEALEMQLYLGSLAAQQAEQDNGTRS